MPSERLLPQTWTTERPRPEWLRQRPDACYFALGAVCIGAFMGQLDASIVTLAVPTLQHAFHASLASANWVGLSYLIALVAGVTVAGRVSDMVGRKLLYTWGFVVFVVASAACAFAPSLGVLDSCRVLQGFGAAMLQANSVAIIAIATPRGSLGRAIGIQGAAQAIGLALGPSIGGMLLTAYGWRSIFLVNVPVGILGITAARTLLPRSGELAPRTRFDWAGLGLAVVSTVALLVGLSYASGWGWTSPAILGLGAASAAGTVTFWRFERHRTDPLVDLSLFSSRAFSSGLIGGLGASTILFGVLLLVPYLLERSRGASPSGAGLVLTTVSIALGITAPLAGRYADRVGSRRVCVAGLALVASSLVVLGIAQPHGLGFFAGLAAIGVGLGAFIPANNASMMAAAPRANAGVASGIVNMTRGLGTALGLALTAMMLGGVSDSEVSSARVDAGFRNAALLLAVVAVSGLVTVARGPACAVSPHLDPGTDTL